MRKSYITPLIAFSLAILLGCTQAVAFLGGFAGGEVYDAERHAKNKQTTMERATQAANTATKIANQITNLASMSPEAHLAHILGIESEVKEITDTVRQSEGLLNSAQTAKEAFGRTFTQVEDFFQGGSSDINRLRDNKTMVITLDKTYRDALRAAKINENIERKVKLISDTMNHNQNASGNKQLKQTAGQGKAIKSVEQIGKVQIMGAFSSVMVARFEKEIQDDAFSVQKTFNELSLGVSDPYNLTKNSLDVYERPKGKGFRRF